MKSKLLQFLLSVLLTALLMSFSSSTIALEVVLTDDELKFVHQKKVLKMCVATNFMPYEDIQNGEYVGMISEYMKLMSRNLGIPFVLVTTKGWDETMQKAQIRECDLIPFIIDTPERRKYFNFTNPYIGEPLVIATYEDKPYVVDVKDILDQRIGIVRGYAYVELLKDQYPGINIVEVDTIEKGLEMLVDGDLYAYLDGLNVIGYNIQLRKGISNLKINGTLKNEYDVSIASRNDMPILNQVLEKGLQSITKEEQNEIKKSWVKVTYEHRFDYSLIIQLAVLTFLIFGFMFYHQTILRKHNKVLEALSETDTLTKINNRLKLDKFLQYQLDSFERYHEEFSIILIDIDHFKKFNDTFGHLIGDKVLVHVADIMKKNCRKLDMIGRWGGEEFLMICPNTNIDNAATLAESLRTLIEETHLKNIEGVTISLGIAEMNAFDNFNTIVARADKALFSAKQNGRNRVGVARS